MTLNTTIPQTNNLLNEVPPALQAFAAYPQWILWFMSDGKKLPVDYRTGQPFTKEDDWQNNPNMWTDAQTAIDYARAHNAACGYDKYKVGFFFTKEDKFYFVDIDKCLLDSGEWSDTAKTVMSYFPGAAVEVSCSGAGLHIFGTYTTMPDHACKNIPLGLELYTERRFVALTGTNIIGNAGTNGDQYLDAFVNTYMPPRVTVTPEAWTTEPVPGYTPLDDEALIKKALGSKSAAGAFGVKATFADLWYRNVDALALAYPPDQSDSGKYDESSVDMALAQHLTFWCGKNCEAIERLMWLSKLVRDKWGSPK